MTALLTIVLPALILAAWLLERRETAAAMERERKQWWDERTQLLNRIKPETAQPVLGQPVEIPAPVKFDDDDAFWAVSKDQLADAAMKAELA